ARRACVRRGSCRHPCSREEAALPMAQSKRKVIWAQPAVDQLDEIAEYIALDNVDAAAELISACFEAVDRLIAFPDSGRLLPELKDRRYREVIVVPCRIIYRRADTN